MIPGSQGLYTHEHAHMCVNDFGTRQNTRIKAGRKSHDMRVFCRIVRVRSTEQSVGIIIFLGGDILGKLKYPPFCKEKHC